MIEAISLDRKTMIIRSDEEAALAEIVNIVIKRNRHKDIKSFLQFAARNRRTENNFKFNREECYDRKSIINISYKTK